MKIAININTLQNGHKTRGIGYYTTHLLNELKKDDSLNIQEFTDIKQVDNADVIHYPWFDLFFPTLPIRKAAPTVVTVHDVMPLLFPKEYPVGIKGKINFFLQKKSLEAAKFIITDSKISKKDIIKHLKIKEEKIAVIPLAADDKFKVIEKDSQLIQIRRKYNLPDKFLLFVGDVNWVKNLPFLIEAFKQLKDASSFEDIKLVLVGGVFLKKVENINHPELASLKLINKLISDYNLENHIIRPGQISDEELVVFYNLATIYIQPSIYEGFGLPVLQALSCGCPVISSNRGSLPEVGGEAAIYFDPVNPQNLVKLIKDLFTDNSLRVKLSKLGLNQANNFSWSNTAKQTLEIYRKASANG